MAEGEARGDFDYRWDEPTDGEELTAAGHAPEDEVPEGADDADGDLRRHNGEPVFDAFNADTWHFTPTSEPWYRGKQAMLALVATGAAVVAIVVCGVLLVFRGAPDGVSHFTQVTQTATATSSAPAAAPSSVVLPPPPPPQPAASPVNPAPSYNPVPGGAPPETKAPEIGVTRTPITRLPLSVAPEPRRSPSQPPPTGGGRGGH